MNNYLLKPMTACNWNAVEDETDLIFWERLVQNFWIDTAIPLSNDLQSWATMTEEEKLTTQRVFGGLSLLDDMQSAGAAEIMQHPLTPHEESVMANLVFMEKVHQKSYSSIFSTLNTTEEINDIFRWVVEDEHLQKKAQIIQSYYDEGDPLKMRIASTMLESFLFYSGFYWPFYLSSRGKLTNSADIIRLIVRDEQLHGVYIGYKYQQATKDLPQREKDYLYKFTSDLAKELYDNEVIYTQKLYDGVGRTEDVLHFIRYNMNKALMNLGYEPWFDKDQTHVSAAIMSSLTPDGENFDFFSGAGSSYIMGKVEELDEDEWSF